MKKKRFIAVALSALAFISLFACSKKTTNKKTTTDKKATQVTTQKTTSKKTTTSSHEELNGVNFLLAKNDYNLLFAQHVSGGTLDILNLCINYKNALIFQIMRDHSTDTIKSVSVASTNESEYRPEYTIIEKNGQYNLIDVYENGFNKQYVYLKVHDDSVEIKVNDKSYTFGRSLEVSTDYEEITRDKKSFYYDGNRVDLNVDDYGVHYKYIDYNHDKTIESDIKLSYYEATVSEAFSDYVLEKNVYMRSSYQIRRNYRKKYTNGSSEQVYSMEATLKNDGTCRIDKMDRNGTKYNFTYATDKMYMSIPGQRIAEYQLDEYKRIIKSIDYPNEHTTDIEYNSDGYLKSITENDTIKYEYNYSNDLIDTMVQYNKVGENFIQGPTTYYYYSADKKFLGYSRRSSSTKLAELNIVYENNLCSEVSNIIYNYDGTVYTDDSYKISYKYDSNKMINYVKFFSYKEDSSTVINKELFLENYKQDGYEVSTKTTINYDESGLLTNRERIGYKDKLYEHWTQSFVYLESINDFVLSGEVGYLTTKYGDKTRVTNTYEFNGELGKVVLVEQKTEVDYDHTNPTSILINKYTNDDEHKLYESHEEIYGYNTLTTKDFSIDDDENDVYTTVLTEKMYNGVTLKKYEAKEIMKDGVSIYYLKDENEIFYSNEPEHQGHVAKKLKHYEKDARNDGYYVVNEIDYENDKTNYEYERIIKSETVKYDLEDNVTSSVKFTFNYNLETPTQQIVYVSTTDVVGQIHTQTYDAVKKNGNSWLYTKITDKYEKDGKTISLDVEQNVLLSKDDNYIVRKSSKTKTTYNYENETYTVEYKGYYNSIESSIIDALVEDSVKTYDFNDFLISEHTIKNDVNEVKVQEITYGYIEDSTNLYKKYHTTYDTTNNTLVSETTTIFDYTDKTKPLFVSKESREYDTYDESGRARNEIICTYSDEETIKDKICRVHDYANNIIQELEPWGDSYWRNKREYVVSDDKLILKKLYEYKDNSTDKYNKLVVGLGDVHYLDTDDYKGYYYNSVLEVTYTENNNLKNIKCYLNDFDEKSYKEYVVKDDKLDDSTNYNINDETVNLDNFNYICTIDSALKIVE